MTANSTSSRLGSGPLWHPTEYPRILYKRRAIAIPVFLLFFLSGTISSVRTVPTYEAMTQVLIEPEPRRATTLSTVLESEPDAEDDFYQTQYRILESRSLAFRAVDALEKEGIVERQPAPRRFSFSIGGAISAVRNAVSSLWSDRPAPAQASKPTPADETRAQSAKINAFLGGLDVTPVRFSRLVEIKFRSPDMEYAAHAANQLAKQYMVHALEYRFLASKEANTWLSEQLKEQRDVVAKSEQALQRFREAHNTVSIGDRQNITIQKLTELNAQVTKAKIERYEKEALYRQLTQLREAPGQLDTFPAIMQNDVVQKTKQEIAALRDEKAKLEAKGYGSAHSDMKTNASRLTVAETRLQGEIENIAQSVKNAYEAARATEASLVQALEGQKGEATTLGAKEVQYAALEREAVGNRKLYEDLLDRTKETGVSGKFEGSTVQVVDRAEVPESPVLPQVRRDMTVAALTGFVLAVMLAFGFEYFDSRIKSPEEIKAHLGVPFLGLVPVAPGAKNSDGEAPMLSGEGPPAFAEAMRGLRTAVLFSSAEEGARSVLVTSTGPSEGKTVIAGCLAITLAQAGQKTLVIDADMRRPRLHEALGRPQEPGLSNLLVGDTSVDDVIRPTSMPNLSLVSAGHIPPNPAELLGSKKFETLFADFKKRFDWVIIDAPPVLPVTDAAVLGHLASGVLFVIGAEMTPRSSAANAIEQLRRAKAKMIGVVLNRVNVTRHSYYYRAYYRKDYAKYYQGSANRA